MSILGTPASNGIGQIRYNAVSAVYESFNGSSWTPLANPSDVGVINYFASISLPSDYLELNGDLLTRQNYPELWAYASNSGNIVSEANWATAKGSFSSGDGTTTFRIPDLRGEFIRSWDDGRGVDNGRTLGSSQGDAIRNIIGTFDANTDDGPSFKTGALYDTGTPSGGANGAGAAGASGVVGFDASRVVPTSNENRPRNVALILAIKFKSNIPTVTPTTVPTVGSGGATGGGNDRVFYENDIAISANYTITAGKNAMTAGPVTINTGVVVTVPNGSTWSVI